MDVTDLLLRRRELMMVSKKTTGLLYPDAFMVVFDTNSNSSSVVISNAGTFNEYVLDGIKYEFSSKQREVTPPLAGRHILYYWVDGFADRLVDNCPILYLRIPENHQIHNAYVYNVLPNLKQIDFMGFPPDFSPTNQFWRWGVNDKIIRVPIGMTAQFKAVLTGNGVKNATYIETDDFNIDVNSL